MVRSFLTTLWDTHTSTKLLIGLGMALVFFAGDIQTQDHRPLYQAYSDRRREQAFAQQGEIHFDTLANVVVIGHLAADMFVGRCPDFTNVTRANTTTFATSIQHRVTHIGRLIKAVFNGLLGLLTGNFDIVAPFGALLAVVVNLFMLVIFLVVYLVEWLVMQVLVIIVFVPQVSACSFASAMSLGPALQGLLIWFEYFAGAFVLMYFALSHLPGHAPTYAHASSEGKPKKGLGKVPAPEKKAEAESW